MGAYTRARELCRQVGEASEHFVVLWGLWRFYRQGAELRQARELADELLGLAQHQQDPALLIQAHHANWTNQYLMGEFASAREHAEQGIAYYRPQVHHAQAFLFGGHDPCVCARTRAADSLWTLGYPDQAMKRFDEALALAHKLNHPSSLALVLDEFAQHHQRRGEAAMVRERAEALVALATDQGFTDKLVTGTLLCGWASSVQGREEAGIAEMREAVAQAGARAEIQEPYFVALAAEAWAKTGAIDEGLSALAGPFDGTDDNEVRYWEAEFHRLKGELLLASSGDNQPEAETCFQKALEVARRQSAKSLELRAATSLANLWQEQGKVDEARDLLAPVYGWFTEGFDTADLKDASALLDHLG